jgi:ubiquinone/menaquinone biosynthesis C-methylase UbiE
MAGQVSHIHGIDISDAAVQSARTEAARLGITNATFAVMDAEHLEFEDESFDMIFGSGIIHHLDLTRAYGELSRVLKRGGVAVFIEPLGHNPFINSYRDRTPELRTPDEHPLMRSDVHMAREYFDSISCQAYGLATLAAIPFLKTSLGKPIMAVGRGLDRVLLKVPGLKWWAWYSLLVFKRA